MVSPRFRTEPFRFGIIFVTVCAKHANWQTNAKAQCYSMRLLSASSYQLLVVCVSVGNHYDGQECQDWLLHSVSESVTFSVIIIV